MKYSKTVYSASIQLRRATCVTLWLIHCCLLVLIFPQNGFSTIGFKEVTREAGITHKGTTYGASWGDFNGDGWPDLWVGNHNTKPTLYLNMKDGTFNNIIDQVWSGDVKADTHAVAWADFDNDGDQDLVELLDALENEDGTFSLGAGRNHLFINEQGKLYERAAKYNLDQTGFGRTPLWFDANQDGKLDLIVVNTKRPGEQPPSKLFLQKKRQFIDASETMNFTDAKLSDYDVIKARINRLLNFQYPSAPYFWAHRHLEFAQIADISGNHFPELILFSNPLRVFRIDNSPFQEITTTLILPNRTHVTDAAIADFNGDTKMDLYLTRCINMPSDVIRVSASEIKGYITCAGGGDPKGVRFRAEGKVHFQIYPTWLPLSKIRIGSDGHHPHSRSFSLSPSDYDQYASVGIQASEIDGPIITYSNETRTWTFLNYHRSIFTDLNVKASETISNFETIGFSSFKEQEADSLLLQHKNNEFVEKKLDGKAGAPSSCYSVVAGDFDNDMDVDLYMTCTRPAINLPNRLLENDGKGNFHLVADAGGAAGSDLGRGDVVATADYNRDGFLDLFVTNGRDPTSPLVENGPHQLFLNTGNNNHWLEIDLCGTQSNRDGIGTKVEVVVNDITQVREQNGGIHRITQNHQRLHFGLGPHHRIDRITVKWPSGNIQQLNDINANQILRITEPS